MTEIIPAVLPEDYQELREDLALVHGLSSFVQIDICDGEFVPRLSWPYGEPETFEKILVGEEGMPFWKEIQFEADLMVSNPEDVIDDWINAGFSRMVIHYQSTNKLEDILDKLSEFQVECGIAIQIDDEPQDLAPYIDKIGFVQCMGIENIGYQGEPFSQNVVHKIKKVREIFPDILISVDGGVSLDTVERLSDAGARRLISGSAILGAESPKEAFDAMRNLANK